jgi:hypoxanthine phosphoribosyltransferase
VPGVSDDATIGEVLISEEVLQARVAEIAKKVSEDYADRDLLVIGVLKGAIFFIADLVRHLDVLCELDFMAVSSYGSSTHSSGVVRILKDLEVPIAGRHVLLVEDVVDSGLTLSYLIKNLRARGPASLEICALLTKPGHRRLAIPTRYVGFELDDIFVIGYGLDHAQRYRNLPYIAALELEPAGFIERRSPPEDPGSS